MSSSYIPQSFVNKISKEQIQKNIEQIQKEYDEKANKIIANNFELLKKCIDQNIKHIDTNKQYDITFLCNGFRGLPSKEDWMLPSGYLHIDYYKQIDESKFNNFTKFQYLEEKLFPQLIKADLTQFQNVKELCYNNYKLSTLRCIYHNISPTVINKNKYAIFHNIIFLIGYATPRRIYIYTNYYQGGMTPWL
jgi:superoxide dismutase